MSFPWYRPRAASANCDDDTTRTPQLGDRDVVSAAEFGRKAAENLAMRSPSATAKPVKQIILHADSSDMVIARKYVRHPHDPGKVIPRAIGWTATGRTKSGDVVAATHVARVGAVVNGEQMKSLRHAADCVIGSEGEATDIFAFAGARHWLEAAVLRWGDFKDVRDHQVPSKALKDVRHWMPGDRLQWLKLESWAAKRAAEELRSTLESMRDADELIKRARAAGIEPDNRVIHRRRELEFGLGNRWIYVGARLVMEVHREPSVEVVEAASGKNK
jgi:hypothetical protein